MISARATAAERGVRLDASAEASNPRFAPSPRNPAGFDSTRRQIPQSRESGDHAAIAGSPPAARFPNRADLGGYLARRTVAPGIVRDSPSRIHSAAIIPRAGEDWSPDPPAPATDTTHG